MKNCNVLKGIPHSIALVSLGLLSNYALADQQILDDLIVDGSICVGQDCVNGESFGFDTLRLKENNLRIKAQDTSNSASFPTNDWQITFNDSSNGGANKFSIDDIDGGRTPFTIEAGAPSHSLYVEDGGRVGFGTSTPVVDLHVKSGNTPTMRLEQDGSNGFTAQTWDVAGNEANFFVRDASNGSTLPFRIRPSSPTNSIDIRATGVAIKTPLGVGTGTATPQDDLHISDNGAARLRLTNTTKSVTATEDPDWVINSNGTLRISADSTGTAEVTVDLAGNLFARGDITSGGTTVVPDYVFQPDYELMSLSDLSKHINEKRHLPNIPSATEIKKKGSLNMSKLQMKLLEKIEELTLYTLGQEKTIKSLQERVKKLEE